MRCDMLLKEQVKSICKKITGSRIGIIGDFCVDIYWHADMTKSELSRETPHYPLPIVKERVYPGAGGNVAFNLAALNPAVLYPISLYSDDWRGMLMEDIIKKSGMDVRYMIKTENRFTNAYCKPMRKGISSVEYEDPRLDFDNFEPISHDIELRVINALHEVAEKVDILCVADQFKYGIVTDMVRKEIISLAKSGLTVVADSRYNISKYTNCILKPNEVECWRAVYGDERYISASYDEFVEAAEKLAVKNSACVFCTLGRRGSVVTDGEKVFKTDAVKYDGEIDICGAGDTSLSAFSAALASGASSEEAAAFAGLASGVTVRKIGVTGTASAEEIVALAEQ